MRARPDAVMRTAAAILRLLVILNFVAGFAFLAALGATFLPSTEAAVAEGRPGADVAQLLTAMRVILIIVLAAVPLAHLLLTRLRAMVATVQAGDPFVAANAGRLKGIAWCLLGLQLCDLAFGLAALTLDPQQDASSGWTLSLTGWVAVLLLFVLARVFDQGTRMREDLAGTV